MPLPMSPGEQLIDLVHIDDIVDAYLLAADHAQSEDHVGHRSFAISSGSPIKLKQLVKIYSEVTGKKLNIEWGGRPYKEREVMETWHCGKILPEWSPKIDFEEGIKTLKICPDANL